MEQLQAVQQHFEQEQFADYLSDVDAVLQQLKETEQWSAFVTQLLNKVRAYLALNNQLAAANVLTDYQEIIAQHSTAQQQIAYYHLLADAADGVESIDIVFSYLQKAKLLAELFDEQSLLPVIYYHLSIAYAKNGEQQQSFTYAKQSATLPMDEHTRDALRRRLHYAELLIQHKQLEEAANIVAQCKTILAQKPYSNETIMCWQVEARLFMNEAEAYTFLTEKIAHIAEHSIWCDQLYDAICVYAKESQPNAVYIAELQRALTMKERVLAIQNQQQLELLQSYMDDAHIKKLAWTDTLTNIPNRRYIQQLFPSLTTPYTAFLFDVDHFKRINDTAGHLVGDDVLKEIVSATMRVIPTTSHFVRLGGDEFFGILYEEPKQVAEQLVEAVRNIAILHEGRNIRPTISVGVYTVTTAETLQTVLQRTDEALYIAKGRGKNQFVFINEGCV